VAAHLLVGVGEVTPDGRLRHVEARGHLTVGQTTSGGNGSVMPREMRERTEESVLSTRELEVLLLVLGIGDGGADGGR